MVNADKPAEPMVETSPVRRVFQIMRTASSWREGAKRLVRAVFWRAPFLRPVGVTTRIVKQRKTEFWQDAAGFEYFVGKNEPDPAKNPSAAYLNRVTNDFFLAQCPDGARVLDVGCGHGLVSIFLAQHGRSVTACDVSEPMLQELARNSAGLKIRIERADAYHLPFADGEFDVVLSRQFVYQFPDWERVLAEMARCCRPGGRLLVHFTSRENLVLGAESGGEACDFGEINRVRQIIPGQEQNFIGAFDRREIERACRRNGLRIAERSPCSFFYYNRVIGHALGTESFQEYTRELLERLKDPKVLEFVLWFEKRAVQRLPEWASFWNILVLEKAPH
jgi:SAM-dependent methyltransferase